VVGWPFLRVHVVVEDVAEGVGWPFLRVQLVVAVVVVVEDDEEPFP
jgi:hypothetical protein